MFFSLSAGLKSPYIPHADLYVWDARAGRGRTLDAVNSTVSLVPEDRRGAAHGMRQLTVTNQPDSGPGGMIFPVDGPEVIGTNTGTGPTLNGTNGLYYACLMKVNTGAGVEAGNIQFRTPASSAYGRLYSKFNWSKNLYLYGKADDITNVQYGVGPAITYGTWVAIEVEILLGSSGHVKIWYNGTPQTVTAANPTVVAVFPSSDSHGFFNLVSTDSTFAIIAAGNRVLPAPVRQSVSNWINTIRLTLP